MRLRNLVASVTVALVICASVVAFVRVQASPQEAGVEIGPDGAQEARPGQHIAYDHTLTNTGTATDTFSIDLLSSAGWPVELLSEQHSTGSPTLTLEVGPGVSTALQVSLTVPANAGGVTDVTVITATSQVSPTVRDTAFDTTTVPALVYLPLVTRRWPPLPDTPVLNAISNPDGDGDYTVSWEAAYLADDYVLQEDDNPAFSSPSTVYSGSGTSDLISGQSPGTYYYRVKATNDWGDSGWSNVQDVTVTPPTATVYVQNDTGGTLCYEVYDTGIGEKCFSSGKHLYGSFPSGTYTYHASAPCGSLTKDRTYPSGETTHRFWCE